MNYELQNVDGTAPIISHSATPLFMNAIADLTNLYNGNLSDAKRGIAIVNKKYVIVKDEVTATGKETVLRWTMLTPATVSLTGGNTAELTIGGKKLTLQIAEPAGVNIVTRPATPLYNYDAPNPGTTIISFEIKLPPATRQSITVMLIPETAGSPGKESRKPLAEWPK